MPGFTFCQVRPGHWQPYPPFPLPALEFMYQHVHGGLALLFFNRSRQIQRQWVEMNQTISGVLRVGTRGCSIKTNEHV